MLLMALLALAAAAPDAGPLEPARAGLLQCYGPNRANRTCNAIGAYRFEADGVIWNDARNMIMAVPEVVLYASSKVLVRDNAECAASTDLERDITAVEVDGVPLGGEIFQTVRKQIADSRQASIGDGEYCSTYHPSPDGTLRAVVTLDGVELPAFESTVLWIDPADGWALAPPPT
jgi:hypothetical protein